MNAHALRHVPAPAPPKASVGKIAGGVAAFVVFAAAAAAVFYVACAGVVIAVIALCGLPLG